MDYTRDHHAAQVRLARGFNRRDYSLQAKLAAVEAEIIRLRAAQPQVGTGHIPPSPRGNLGHPCARCGREQPAGQTRADLEDYAVLNPTAVLYFRKDGVCRAHESTCDLLPHRDPADVADAHCCARGHR